MNIHLNEALPVLFNITFQIYGTIYLANISHSGKFTEWINEQTQASQMLFIRELSVVRHTRYFVLHTFRPHRIITCHTVVLCVTFFFSCKHFMGYRHYSFLPLSGSLILDTEDVLNKYLLNDVTIQYRHSFNIFKRILWKYK